MHVHAPLFFYEVYPSHMITYASGFMHLQYVSDEMK